MKYALAFATGALTSAIGFPATTITGLVVCVTSVFIVTTIYSAIDGKNK